MKLIFIAGMAHSGSSLLDMLLSGHSGIVGLGETDFLINPKKRERHVPYAGKINCSCGKPLLTCPIWSPHLKTLRERPEADFQSCYSGILDRVKKEHDSTIAIVDSSKYVQALRKIIQALPQLNIRKEDLYVIHLTKDVRNYTVSRQHRISEKKSTFRLFQKWIKAHKAVEAMARKEELNYLKVGYEEICFYPEYMLSLICNFTQIPFEEAMVVLSNSHGHLGVGNPMSTDPHKSKRIFYDHRWLPDHQISIWYALYPFVKRFNREWVYSNILSMGKQPGLYIPMTR